MILRFKKIEIEIRDKIITVWLNQPEIHNALNPSIIDELITFFKWVNKQDEIRVILIRGRGSSFCAGADLNWMINSGLSTNRKNQLDSKKLALCFRIIYRSKKVVINLVHGYAFGGASGFLGAGDFNFAVKSSVFSLPELRLGLVPSVIMPYIMTRVKLPDIKYQIFTGGKFTAEEALRIGLIDRVYDSIFEMEKKADELVQKIGSTSPEALSEAKKLIRRLNKSLINSDNIETTVKTITRMKMSDDAKRRMSEFVLRK